MVKLTVLLIRCAECEDDESSNEETACSSPEQEQEQVNAELNVYIADQAGDEQGKPNHGKLSLSQRVDPELTEQGFVQAQDAMTSLLDAISSSDDERKIAFFSAPNKSCTSTALMMSCADVSKRTTLTWRLTTLEGASAPAAIPVVVSNGLCNGSHQVIRFGGAQAVVDAGLMHCAGLPFNDGRTKCPFMKVFKKMKEKTQERIDEWDEKRDETGKKVHTVNYVQFMRIDNPSNPWSLVEMVPKINILVDFIEPKRYMLPPRKGWTDPQQNFDEWKYGADPAVRKTVWWARQAGCETVVMIVPGPAMQDVTTAAGCNVPNTSPCCMASLTADIDDDDTTGDSLKWTMHGFFTAGTVKRDGAEVIPPFQGPINALVQPHPDKDPANAPASNKWAAFPEPEPEDIPPGYPDLPPFSSSLEEPLPKVSTPWNKQASFKKQPERESQGKPKRKQ